MPRSGIAPGAAAALIVVVLAVGIVAGYESGNPHNSTVVDTATVTSSAPGSSSTMIGTTVLPPHTATVTNSTVTTIVTQTVTVTSSASPAELKVSGTGLFAADFATGTGGTVTCASPSPTTSYIALTNTGSGSTSIVLVTITWAGSTNYFPLTIGQTCPIGPAGSSSATLFAEIVRSESSPKVSASPVLGGYFTGTVLLANGVLLPFGGNWR